MKTAHEKAVGVLDTPSTALTKSNTTNVSPAENLGKWFATLQARCALAGVGLHRLENDHGNTVYIVSRWALTRELTDLNAVSAWLDRVTGVQP